jgi:hypothetical protein
LPFMKLSDLSSLALDGLPTYDTDAFTAK